MCISSYKTCPDLQVILNVCPRTTRVSPYKVFFSFWFLSPFHPISHSIPNNLHYPESSDSEESDDEPFNEDVQKKVEAEAEEGKKYCFSDKMDKLLSSKVKPYNIGDMVLFNSSPATRIPKKSPLAVVKKLRVKGKVY